MTMRITPATRNEDTIAAISTPPGEGAIGIVRLSGPKAIDIVEHVFTSTRGRRLSSGSGRVFHGVIRDGDETLDEVLVHVMRAPHSYTREDVVEINGHGGAGPLQAMLELLLKHGARLAEPGEFTKRAFLNGRIDLVQAEAVIDRIRAQTHAALRAAESAAKGELSRAIYTLHDTLSGALSRIEAAIDFPDDDLPELVDDALRGELEGCQARIAELLRTSETGRLVREGARVAIAGRPNVGKSSLFNALLRDTRAIVTAHPGTTRDLIEEVINIRGIPVRLSDTAGLRATEDEVEQAGIAVARGAFQSADAILFVLDATHAPWTEDAEPAKELLERGAPFVLVLNKTDLHPGQETPRWAEQARVCVRVSAKTGEGLAALEDAIAGLLLGGAAVPVEQALVTRAHQRDSLRRAQDALARLLSHYGASPEFLSIDLREALHALGAITGETTPEDVLDRIFSSFCIGK